MSQSKSSTNNTLGNTVIPMVILTALFFILGFVTWLNGPLIPFFKTACELTESQSYFVAFAFYIAYFVMAIPSSLPAASTCCINTRVASLVAIAGL